MDDSLKQSKPARNNSCSSILFQSSFVQRGVCWYNGLHTILLDYGIDYVYHCWITIHNLFNTKVHR